MVPFRSDGIDIPLTIVTLRRSPLSAPAESVNRASRIGELNLSSGQKFACCVPLFCISSTRRLGGVMPAPVAANARASGAANGIAASALSAFRREAPRGPRAALPLPMTSRLTVHLRR